MPTRSIYRVLSERMRKWEKAFQEFVRILCSQDVVLMAYLVGSRARGDNLPYSDYDVVVIVPDTVDKIDAAIRLRGLRPDAFPLDLIVLHEGEVGDKVYEEMLGDAKRLC